MMKGVIFFVVLMMVAGSAAVAGQSSCPKMSGTTPGWAQTGPYQIVGYGTKNARATGLPNCEVVMYHLGGMVTATHGGVTWEITEEDGTYAVQLKPAY